MAERAFGVLAGVRLDHSSPVPLYHRAAQALERAIEDGRLPRGSKLDGELDLAEQLGTSRPTIRAPRDADLVIGVGTRWGDFTTASRTAFQNPDVRFVNVNIADFDAHKHAGLALVGDARDPGGPRQGPLEDYEVERAYRELSARANREWGREVERLYTLEHGPVPAQSEVLGTVNSFS